MGRPKKQRVRVHFIPEWSDHRGLKQADFIRLTGADKGTVSRWFRGTIPGEVWYEPLREALGLDDIRAIFRHPDDDALIRMVSGRPEDERERMATMFQAAFPAKRTGTGG